MRQLAAGQRRSSQAHSGVAGPQRLYHHGEHLRPLGLQVQDHFGAGDGDRACSAGGRRLRKSLEGGLSRKSGEKNKSLLWSLTLRKRYKKKAHNRLDYRLFRWRRWRDSNSRVGLSRPTAFRVRTLQPLGYISVYFRLLLTRKIFWREKQERKHKSIRFEILKTRN